MTTPSQSVNAWILPYEDDPSGTNYNSPNSSYQSLINYGVYNYFDMLNIAFVNTVPTSNSTIPAGNGSTYTLEIQTADHPNPYTNQQYMDWIIRDARNANPNIKILVTLGLADNEFTQIFQGPSSQWQQAATDYANNVVAYLKNYGLNGFDIDWEDSVDSTPSDQVSLVLNALRTAFDAQSDKYYLTLSPATAENLEGSFVNNTIDFINLQLYSGFTKPSEFTQVGISASLFAYGAKFESIGDGITKPFQTAQAAYQGMNDGHYGVVTQWRLNSGDFQYEQAQQMILYQLVYGLPDNSFDDTPIIGAAGNPPITQIVVRSGEVLDAIQSTNTGAFESNVVEYVTLQHGGNSGSPTTVTIPEGDSVAEVAGYTGVWFGWECVLQITITARNGKVFGPFGNMNNALSQTPFNYVAPQGQSIVAFSGTIVNVPLAGGGTTYIVAGLNASYA